MKFSCIGISRHRIGTDGVGVTTLVGGLGCPLECKYCLNPHCKSEKHMEFSLDELYERLRIDSLYFTATGGGITFGGGEPLLQAGFIRDFIFLCRKKREEWRFTLETCLAVPTQNLTLLDGLINEYVVDIKDMNPDIYRAYTGKGKDMLMANLHQLSKIADKVTVKIPLIPNFNTVSDVKHSKDELTQMGFCRFEIFQYRSDVKKVHKMSPLPIDSQRKT